MGKGFITDSILTAIADAIRTKLGVQTQYKPSQMAAAIIGIQPNLQSKTVTPNASQQTVQPDSGYDGLSSVIVNGDADLVAGNIKKDVEVFGVTGTYEGSGGGVGTLLMSQGQVSTDSAYATAYFASGVDLTQYDAIVVKMYENDLLVSRGATIYVSGTVTFYNIGDLDYTMQLTATTIKCIGYRGIYRNLYVDVYGVNL